MSGCTCTKALDSTSLLVDSAPCTYSDIADRQAIDYRGALNDYEKDMGFSKMSWKPQNFSKPRSSVVHSTTKLSHLWSFCILTAS